MRTFKNFKVLKKRRQAVWIQSLLALRAMALYPPIIWLTPVQKSRFLYRR